MPEKAHDIDRLQAACDELRIINNLINRISQVRETNHIMHIIIGELGNRCPQRAARTGRLALQGSQYDFRVGASGEGCG